MIFNIATSHGSIRGSCSFKFTKDLLICFTQNIGQDIQPSPMCHTDHYFLHIVERSNINNGIQRCNGGFSSFKREPFLTNIFGMKEFFEHHPFIEFLQYSFPLLQCNRLKHGLLNRLDHPFHFTGTGICPKFNTKAIGIAFL